jgi:hypothetical protein
MQRAEARKSRRRKTPGEALSRPVDLTAALRHRACLPDRSRYARLPSVRMREGDPPAAALTRLAREESGRVLAVLARQFGLDLADEAVRSALAEAAAHWPDSGVPDNPPGWLMTVARNKAIDRLRRAASPGCSPVPFNCRR